MGLQKLVFFKRSIYKMEGNWEGKIRQGYTLLSYFTMHLIILCYSGTTMTATSESRITFVVVEPTSLDMPLTLDFVITTMS